MKNNKNKNWQRKNQKIIDDVEKTLFNYLKEFFANTEYQVIFKPTDLNQIYQSVNISPKLNAQIYQPLKQIERHGIVIDYLIINQKTNKRIYIELKKQDGWVEGKLVSAGRGNAHERSCKLFAPGIVKLLRQKTLIDDDRFLPFVIIYTGDISRDPKRVREITFWFDEYQDNYWFWINQNDAGALKSYLFDKVLPKLN